MAISLRDLSSGKSESNCALADNVDRPLLGAVYPVPDGRAGQVGMESKCPPLRMYEIWMKYIPPK